MFSVQTPGTHEESWIHVQLSPTANQRAVDEAVRLLPMVVADAGQVARDSAELSATLLKLAHDIGADDGTRFAAPIPAFTLSVPRTLH